MEKRAIEEVVDAYNVIKNENKKKKNWRVINEEEMFSTGFTFKRNEQRKRKHKSIGNLSELILSILIIKPHLPDFSPLLTPPSLSYSLSFCLYEICK